jgi:hypothetical protein
MIGSSIRTATAYRKYKVFKKYTKTMSKRLSLNSVVPSF